MGDGGVCARNPSPYVLSDLARVQQDFRLSSRMRASIGVNVTNLFDQKTITRFNTTPYRDQFNLSDAAFFGGFDPAAVASSLNFRRDARLGMASEFQEVRVIRLQAKLIF